MPREDKYMRDLEEEEYRKFAPKVAGMGFVGSGAGILPKDKFDWEQTPLVDPLVQAKRDSIMKDPCPVNSPGHYKLNPHGVECIQAIEASMSKEEFDGYLKGNCQKYLWRYKYKGKPVEDLKKAQWYLEKLLINQTKERV